MPNIVFSFSAFCSSVRTTAVLTWTCGCEPQPWSLAACDLRTISAALSATLSTSESSLLAIVSSAFETSAAFWARTKSLSSQWLAACQNYVYVQSSTLQQTVTIPMCFSTVSWNSCFDILFHSGGSLGFMWFFTPFYINVLSSFISLPFCCLLHFLAGSICVFVFSRMCTTPK